MNTTDNQDTYPAPIQVWIDDTGNHYAAQELEPGKVGFYVYRTTSKDGYGTCGRVPNPAPRASVDFALTNNGINGDLSWIESRELEAAARNQDPQPVRTLATAISYPDRCTLTPDTIDEIIRLIGHRCRAETCRTLRNRLNHLSNQRNYGIYDRLQIAPTVSYCAGQDYPGELAEIRRLLIKN